VKLEWTPEMIEKLKSLRERNTPLFVCAELVGAGYAQTVYMARKLNLHNRRNRGRIPGERRPGPGFTWTK
jgi:hypothetical protein